MSRESLTPANTPKAHLISGFLGVGKTTTVRHMLSQKQEHERWAVLVNEFGEIGVDASLLADTGIKVEQIDGGCMCCTAGPVTVEVLRALLQQERPDRLIIEASGLSHPVDTLAMLKKQEESDQLQVCASLTLIDPRYAVREYYQNHPLFQDQLNISDVVVFNKVDLSSEQELKLAKSWVRSRVGPSKPCYATQSGKVDVDWLMKDITTGKEAVAEGAKAKNRPALDFRELAGFRGKSSSLPEPGHWLKSSRDNSGFFTVGWRISAAERWSENKLREILSTLSFLRIKGVIHSDEGWITVNKVEDGMEILPCDPIEVSIIEFIDDSPIDHSALSDALKTAIKEER